MTLDSGAAATLALLLALQGCKGQEDASAVARAEPAESLFATGDGGGFIAAPERPVASGQPAPADPPSRSAPIIAPAAATGAAESQAPAPTAPTPPPAAEPEGPVLAARTIATTVYAAPNIEARRLGYVRLGGVVRRDPEPVAGYGCKGSWYRVDPVGFVCTDDATTDLADPIIRAASRRPALDRPLPYSYGFVRATSPQYLVVPARAQQEKSEFKLDEHIQWFREHEAEVQRPFLGANDVPLDRRGVPRPGLPLPKGERLSTQLAQNELFGGGRDERVPWWLEGGRKIPNVSAFAVPDYAIFADRVRRKTGLSFVDAFVARDGDFARRFAVTVDMRLIPTTKVKPDAGTLFHGVEITEKTPLPFAFVIKRDATTWKLIKGRDEAKPDEPIPRRAVVPLTGNARLKGGTRFYQLARDPQRWLRASDVGVAAPPPAWPPAAEAGKKWIDVSLLQQVLILYEGKKPFYATLVSTGQDRLGDPKTTKATPQGEFRVRSKHVAAAMDSEENSTVLGGQKSGGARGLAAGTHATIDRLLKAEQEGRKLDAEDARRLANIKKGRDPEYGVTERRGSQNYELRDVPWIQYFAAGYALHGAYWHDVFGIPRSHGCINLSPIDARLAFLWTDPPVPEGWHGVNVDKEMGEGTLIVVRE
jgi:lipoprotein-anchoring transpeptidase ErfK/SrfK